MKVRFGFSAPGPGDLALEDVPGLADDLERLGYDSLWLPEVMLGGLYDPVVVLSYAAARTTRKAWGSNALMSNCLGSMRLASTACCNTTTVGVAAESSLSSTLICTGEAAPIAPQPT